MTLGFCPACFSVIKAERGEVKTAYGAQIICTDNWHWVTTLLPASPLGWSWNADDDQMMWRLDLAFQKPLDTIMQEFEYLRI